MTRHAADDLPALRPARHPARAAVAATEDLLRRGHEAGVVRGDFSVDDLYYADVANGLALIRAQSGEQELPVDEAFDGVLSVPSTTTSFAAHL